ncbi:MAG: arylamine N-acetyltransferase [Chitinivibrionales bacterium]|nr:arylamine N-acetyltransferase [Chitinivibrionales bacterium]
MTDIIVITKEAYQRFLHHFGLPTGPQSKTLASMSSSVEYLSHLAHAFSAIPYENLTKILKMGVEKNPLTSRREPDEVIDDHIRFGTGGTCFSLTTTFYSIVKSAGWQAAPILADRSFGENTHSALLVWIDGRAHLLDPGYLIVNPIPLDITCSRVIKTSFNDLVLIPHTDSKKIDLCTEQNGERKYRLTFKTDPVDMGDFVKAWHGSFKNSMMRYPVVTRLVNDRQLYLQQDKLVERGRNFNQRRKLTQQESVIAIADKFGIDASIVRKALLMLQSQGESYGTTPIS